MLQKVVIELIYKKNLFVLKYKQPPYLISLYFEIPHLNYNQQEKKNKMKQRQTEQINMVDNFKLARGEERKLGTAPRVFQSIIDAKEKLQSESQSQSQEAIKVYVNFVDSSFNKSTKWKEDLFEKYQAEDKETQEQIMRCLQFYTTFSKFPQLLQRICNRYGPYVILTEYFRSRIQQNQMASSKQIRERNNSKCQDRQKFKVSQKYSQSKIQRVLYDKTSPLQHKLQKKKNQNSLIWKNLGFIWPKKLKKDNQNQMMEQQQTQYFLKQYKTQ